MRAPSRAPSAVAFTAPDFERVSFLQPLEEPEEGFFFGLFLSLIEHIIPVRLDLLVRQRKKLCKVAGKSQ